MSTSVKTLYEECLKERGQIMSDERDEIIKEINLLNRIQKDTTHLTACIYAFISYHHTKSTLPISSYPGKYTKLTSGKIHYRMSELDDELLSAISGLLNRK